MARKASRTKALGLPMCESEIWLARAERARRIAATLSKADAEIALAHARECEAEAVKLLESRQPPIAA